MRFLLSVLVLLLGLIWGVHSQLSIANLPACGISCVLKTVPASGCSFTDNECLCTNKELRIRSADCVQQNCSMAEALTVAKVQAEICNLPEDDIGHYLAYTIMTVDTFAGLCVILRLISRKYQVGKLGVDDWLISFSVMTLVPLGVMSVQMVYSGFGKHIYQLVDGALLKIFRYFWVSTLLYVLDLGLVKMSLLFFYLRIFPNERFRVVLWISMGFVIVSTLLIIFLAAFQCTPVQFYWNKDVEGKCLNLNAVAYAGAAVSIASDILIVVLPIPVIGSLHLGLMKKIGVAIMFGIGSFGCIISIIRLKSIVTYGESVDPTYDLLMAVVWSCVEVNAAIVCACFPALRKLFAAFAPRMFGSTKNDSSYLNSSKPSRPSRIKSWYAPGSVTTNITASLNDRSEDVELEGRGRPGIREERGVVVEYEDDLMEKAGGVGVRSMDVSRGAAHTSDGHRIRRSNTMDSVNPLVPQQFTSEQDTIKSSAISDDSSWQPREEDLSSPRRASRRLSRLGWGWMGIDRSRDDRSPPIHGQMRSPDPSTAQSTWYDSDSR